jgi:hypothetical protein
MKATMLHDDREVLTQTEALALGVIVSEILEDPENFIHTVPLHLLERLDGHLTQAVLIVLCELRARRES